MLVKCSNVSPNSLHLEVGYSVENIHGTYQKLHILQRPTELWNGSHREALHAHGLGMKKLRDCCGVGDWVERSGGGGRGWG